MVISLNHKSLASTIILIIDKRLILPKYVNSTFKALFLKLLFNHMIVLYNYFDNTESPEV